MSLISTVPSKTSILKIARLRRDGRIKMYTNKNGRDNINKMHPYTVFSSNRVSTKNCVGMHLVCIIPTIVICVCLDPTIPT